MPNNHGETDSRDELSRAKQELRRRVLADRDALPAAVRTRLSSIVCARAAALPELAAAHAILLFASFRSEIDTTPLLAWALEQGKIVCFPRVLGSRHMAAYRVADPEIHLAPGAWGIPEPREGLEEVEPRQLDAVVVPGSVFDTDGRRCGYGGGFYDNYLLLTRPGVPRIALAFEAQIVDALPCEPHDLTVGLIVTEERVIRPNGGGSN
jgi:5-formyltetrahydrofolate cyclo-ligase